MVYWWLPSDRIDVQFMDHELEDREDGSDPTMSDQKRETLHVGRPNLGSRERFLNRVNGMLDRRWFSNNGPLVREFEQAIASYTGARHCIATCNATVGLEMAARALGLSGEVILPAYTFVATAHALQWQGMTPVFCDIDSQTHTIDPTKIEELITDRTTGVVGVHVWGHPCATETIETIARRRGLAVMYDAAHAFGCSHRGQMIGTFGACEVFSFHATKFLNSFEGGAITTNDDELAEKLRLMRNFGFSGVDNVEELGINGKMSEVCAAMGLTSLESIEDIIAVNRRNYEAYTSGLKGVPGVELINYESDEQNNYQYVVIQVDASKAGVSRDELVDALHARSVMARKYFWPGCHRMEPYRTTQPDAASRLPVTDKVAAQVIVLPTGQAVSVDCVAKICQVIRNRI